MKKVSLVAGLVFAIAAGFSYANINFNNGATTQLNHGGGCRKSWFCRKYSFSH